MRRALTLSGLVAAAGLTVLTTAQGDSPLSSPFPIPKTSTVPAPYTQGTGTQQVPDMPVTPYMPTTPYTYDPKLYNTYEPVPYHPEPYSHAPHHHHHQTTYKPEEYYVPHHHHKHHHEPEEYMPHHSKRHNSYEPEPEDEYYEHPHKHGHHQDAKAHPHAHKEDVYSEPAMEYAEPDYDIYSAPEYTEPKHAAAHHAKTTWKKTQKNGFYGERQEAAWEKQHGSHHGHQSGDKKEIQTKEKKGFYHEDEAEVNGQKRRHLGGYEDYAKEGKGKGKGGKGKKGGKKGGMWNKNKKQEGKDWGYAEKAVYGEGDSYSYEPKHAAKYNDEDYYSSYEHGKKGGDYEADEYYGGDWEGKRGKKGGEYDTDYGYVSEKKHEKKGGDYEAEEYYGNEKKEEAKKGYYNEKKEEKTYNNYEPETEKKEKTYLRKEKKEDYKL